MAFLFSPPAISISFPPQTTHRVFQPGDVVSGTVHLRVDVDSKGRPCMDRVDAKFEVKMETSVAMRRGVHSSVRPSAQPGALALDMEDGEEGFGGGQPSSLSSTRADGSKVTRIANQQQGVDVYRETAELYSSDQTLWRATSHPPPPHSADRTAPLVHLPFGFVLPPSFNNFPPSFEGGGRSPFVVNGTPETSDPWAANAGSGTTRGHDVARVEYSILITGHKIGMFSINERTRLPFQFTPPPTIDLSLLPTSLPKPDAPTSTHLPPPPPIGWTTYTALHYVRDGWTPWSKKGCITVRLSLPPMEAVPLDHPIPYHLHISSSPSSPSIPSYLSSSSPLTLSVNRTIFTLARGTGQLIPQSSPPSDPPCFTLDLSAQEKGQSGKREIVCGGLLTLPGGGSGPTTTTTTTTAAAASSGSAGVGVGGGGGPSFPPAGGTRGMLGCEYHLALHVPIPGLGNDLRVQRFVWPIVVGTGYAEEEEKAKGEERRGREREAFERRMRGAGGGEGKGRYSDDGEIRDEGVGVGVGGEKREMSEKY